MFGLEDSYTAFIYNNIAGVYNEQGDYVNALEHYKMALSIREKVLGNEYPDTAIIYNNMALVYYNKGEYLNALEWNWKALNIREKILGFEHPDTVTTYNNIAEVYRCKANIEKRWNGTKRHWQFEKMCLERNIL